MQCVPLHYIYAYTLHLININRYGAARCGLFCALVNILDRLTDQGTIGVFDAVKLVKETRQQFIPDFVSIITIIKYFFAPTNREK